jgi:hypothetical protein
MALLAFIELFYDGFLALMLYQQQQQHQHHRQHLHQMIPCLTVVASLVIPAIFHAIFLWRLVLKEYRYTQNDAFRHWLQDHSSYFPLLFFLGAIRPDILRNLLASNAFGWSLFECPLSARRYVLVLGLHVGLGYYVWI